MLTWRVTEKLQWDLSLRSLSSMVEYSIWIKLEANRLVLEYGIEFLGPFWLVKGPFEYGHFKGGRQRMKKQQATHPIS